jgi:uncharacterized membrane protein
MMRVRFFDIHHELLRQVEPSVYRVILTNIPRAASQKYIDSRLVLEANRTLRR